MKNYTFGFLILFSTLSFAQAQTDLSVQEFERLKNGHEVTVLDVRTTEELKEHGMIAGAAVIDFFGKGFDKQLDKLDKSKTVLVYCASGYRSGETRDLLMKKGFKKVYNLEGGFDAWKRARMPVVRYSGN